MAKKRNSNLTRKILNYSRCIYELEQNVLIQARILLEKEIKIFDMVLVKSLKWTS